MLKKILTTAFCVILTACALTACQEKSKPNEIRLGTIAGPETELAYVAKQVAKEKYGLDIRIVQFSDYTMPNTALADGSIDANMFQHVPYLDEAIKAKGYQLTAIGKVFIYPVAIYSKKIKKLADLPIGATVAIPNDPSNEARALLLLSKAGLITLKSNAGVNATIADISDNPKKLNIKEIDAAQLPRVLKDVDLAVINTNYAAVANLLPSRDGLFVEDANSPYANVVVVRTADKDDPKYQKLIAAFHSEEVLKEANKLFAGQAIPAWK